MGLSAYLDEPLSQFIARQKRASASMPATEADQRGGVTEAERRADAFAQRAEAAERHAAEAEQRAAEAERRANASAPARSIVAPPKPAQQITAPAPTLAQRHTPKGIPVMSTRKKAILRDLESASVRLATAKQSLEDAKHLYRAGMASDPVFAAHVVAGAESEWDRACAAYLSFKG